MRFPLILVILFSIPALAFSATINIPSDFPTIQQGINAALKGDTVLVAPGKYKGMIDFKGKALIVRSSDGPSKTTIDGNALYTVYFQTNEGPDSVIEGFTITNCQSGVTCVNAAPTIKNNIISGNQAGFGGGIYCYALSDKVSPTVIGNIIAENVANDGGLNGKGGGVYCNNCSPTITNNIIYNNSSTHKGGGIACIDCASTIMNNTIVGNSAFLEGGAIYCESGGNLTVANTIAWNNESVLKGPAIRIEGVLKPSALAIEYSDVQGGKASVLADLNSVLTWGPGMIDKDPLFVDLLNHDYHLTFTSPCKDTGDNAGVTEPIDMEGDPRIADRIVDMGADEFHTHLYYSGNIHPGSNINLVFMGAPNTAPVILWLGSGVLGAPITLPPHGDWYLQFPILFQAHFGSIPGPDGYLSFPCTIPFSMITFDLPLQAGIGIELTNLLELVWP